MKKQIAAISIGVLLCIVLAGCTKASEGTTAGSSPAVTQSQTPSGSTDTIKIGILTDVSSPAAATVKWGTAGGELAKNEINAAGGINGRQIELVYRDTATDSANVAQKATELKAAGVVAILGPKSDGEAPAGAQWAENNKFPMVTPSTISTRVTIQNASKYFFACGFNAWAIGRINAKQVEKQGFKSAFFIGNDGGAPADTRDFFFIDAVKYNRQFQNLGSNQVGNSSTEFSNIISSIVGKKPDMLIGGIAGPNFVSLVQQGNQFGLFDVCDYYGWYTTDSSNTSALGDNYPYGHVHGVVLWPFWMDEIPGSTKLEADYIQAGKLRNEDVLPSDMGYAWYHGIKAIIESLKITSDWSPEGITEALTKVSFSTPYGDNIHFRDFDHVLVAPYFYVTADKDTSGKRKIPIGTNVVKYGEEALPTKEEMEDYATKNGLVFKDLSK
jgi:branched-chain amino acid transport system substrate-binding protein